MAKTTVVCRHCGEEIEQRQDFTSDGFVWFHSKNYSSICGGKVRWAEPMTLAEEQKNIRITTYSEKSSIGVSRLKGH